MTRRSKTVTIVIAILGLLLLCGIGAVKLLLNDERLAAFAREKVKTSLGRELTLDELSLQFRPLPTVSIKNATLRNPSWAKEAYFLQADNATARLNVTSLLRGRLEIASLSIEGLTANLEVSPDNQKTWQMQTSPVARDSSPAQSAPLHLTALRLKNVRIRYAKHGEPVRDWRIDALQAHADSGWRNVEIDGKIVRNGIPLQAKAKFADLSRIGQKGAVSDGNVELSLGSARLAIEGSLPISSSWQHHKLNAEFSAKSAKEIVGFFELPNINLAPMKASLYLHGNGSNIQSNNISLQIGHLTVSGDANVDIEGKTPHYRAKLTSRYVDWSQAMRNLGRPPLAPKPPGQLFRDTPLGWKAIAAMQTVNGKIDLSIERIKLRSGIEVKNLQASVETHEKQMKIDTFSFSMLNGHAHGNLLLDGHKKAAKLNLETNKVSLGKWLAAREHKAALSDGPMDIKANVSANGLSMKDLAESLTGQVRINVGPAKLHSKQVQQAETWLIGLAPVFSATKTEHVNLACISAYLPFENGRAAAEPIGGIRSEASQLLASGYIDLKQQTLDLRGQVRARSGVSLGMASIAGGNLKIAGRIDKPSIGLDPGSTPGALARIGAAIMTSGVSILATTLWDAANPASDPCQITFSAHEKKRSSRSKEEKSTQKKPSQKPRDLNSSELYP